MTGQWTQVLYKHQKPPAHQQSLKTANEIQYQHIPETTNRFDILANPSTDLEDCRMIDGTMKKVGECNSPRQGNFVHRENDKLRGRQVHKKDLHNKIPTIVNGLSSTRMNNKRTCQNLKNDPHKPVDHNIVILEDSHTRGLSSNMKNNLNDKYSVYGLVKPGATTATLTSTKIADINPLTKNDLIVFWGGSNDVSKNNSQEGLKNLVHFVQLNYHTNIILLCAPPRHDLPEWSCVNNEIKAFNRKLSKIMKPYKHVSIVTVDTDRKFFTTHGLHMSNLGKEKIASKVSMVVTSIFQMKNVITCLGWKNEYDINLESVSDNQAEDVSVTDASD